MKQYWERRYERAESQWGWTPSVTAKQTRKLLCEVPTEYETLLDVGCGYGRDSIYFAQRGHEVTGIDIATNAVEYGATEIDSGRVELRCADVTDMGDGESFDIIFNNFFLHLLDEASREEALEAFGSLVSEDGLVFSSVASTNDSSFGSGRQKGPQTFVNERGVEKTYFDPDLIAETFAPFERVRYKELSEFHHHDGIHEHVLYVVVADSGQSPDDAIFDENGFETV